MQLPLSFQSGHSVVFANSEVEIPWLLCVWGFLLLFIIVTNIYICIHIYSMPIRILSQCCQPPVRALEFAEGPTKIVF